MLPLSVVCVVTDRIFDGSGFAGFSKSVSVGKESMGSKLLLGRFCLVEDKFKEERRFSTPLSSVVEVPGRRDALISEKTGLSVGRPKRSYVPDGRSCRSLPEALSLISFTETDIGAVDKASMLSSSEEEEEELSMSLTSDLLFFLLNSEIFNCNYNCNFIINLWMSRP